MISRIRPAVAVVGLGAMGSATAYHLARQGARVTGYDRYRPPHTRGSSHGESRIIREAYFEHPAFVPLVQRAYRCWTALERETGRRLLSMTGALTVGDPGGELVTGAVRSARAYAIPHDLLDARAIRRRFPRLTPEPAEVAVLERRGGFLRPEECILAHLEAARSAGADLRYGEPALEWAAEGEGVIVRTPAGTRRFDAVVLAAGPWMPDVAPGLPLVVERQVMTWFRPLHHPSTFTPEAFPVFLWDVGERGVFYGIPDLGHGVKAARHHGGLTSTTIADLGAAASDADVNEVRAFLERRIPDAAGTLADTALCRYTNTPSGRFIVGPHPHAPQVVVVSACSGHGFKFSSAIGAGVADYLATGEVPDDLKAFGLEGTG